jgi:hypothetical protein
MKWEERFSTGKLFLRHTAECRFYIRHIEIDLEECFSAGDWTLKFRRAHYRYPTDYDRYFAGAEFTGNEWKLYYHMRHFGRDETDPQFSTMGISYYQGARSTSGSESWRETGRHVTLVLPIWPLIVISGGLFLLSLLMMKREWRKLRQARWSIKGLCAGCGYDLRAHKPGEKCPECGLVINGAALKDQKAF